MSESKILVIDADVQRSETLRSILQFIDWRSVLLNDASELMLGDHTPQDWAAVVLGKFEDWAVLKRFTDWLKRDHYHPPLLVLPEFYEQVVERMEFDRLACMPLTTRSGTTARAGLLEAAPGLGLSASTRLIACASSWSSTKNISRSLA